MKLVSCHIGGFGKIKEFTYDFTQGLNVFCQDNGWGKTTFSVFVKAMFYGMEYSRKQGLSEREHYRPWEGGTYGGSLVFETEKKRYRVERTFGKNDKEDTFALYDDATGMASGDYSANLGEELFEVDRASFEKSIFIPQNALETRMTDSLNAKMGNLSTVKDDINNFDKAVKAIDEARKNYTRRSRTNTGKLELIRQSLRGCNELLEQQETLEKGYEQQTALLEAKKRELSQLEAKKNAIAEQIRDQSKREQSLGAYQVKKQELEKRLGEMEELNAFFVKGRPAREELEEMEELERQETILWHQIQDKKAQLPPQETVEQLEILFATRVPEEMELHLWKRQATRLNELRVAGESHKMTEESKALLQEMTRFFAKKLPGEEELAAVEKKATELTRLDGRLSDMQERLQTFSLRLAEREKQITKNRSVSGLIVCLILSAALLGGAIAFRFLASDSSYSGFFQVLCLVLAVLISGSGVVAFLRGKGRDKKELEELRRQKQEDEDVLKQYEAQQKELTEACRTFLMDFRLPPLLSIQQMLNEIRKNLELYGRLKEEQRGRSQEVSDTLEELADLQLSLYTALEPYSSAYRIDLYHDLQEQELLNRLQNDAEKYISYRQNYGESLELVEKWKDQEEILHVFLAGFPVDSAAEMADQLKEIRGKWDLYENVSGQIDGLRREIQLFEREHQVDEQSLSVEELQKEQQKLDEGIAAANQNIAQDRETLASMSEELEKFEEAQARKEQLEEEMEAAKKKVWLLENTYAFLQEARERFLAKYMEPLQRGLEKYLKLIDINRPEELSNAKVTLDMELGVQLIYQGTSRTGDYLSAGYQNLAAFCSRLALLDVLYKKEQPVLIVDDPFTNLDSDKITEAMELLRKIARDRQVIYFTCHQSRNPLG